MKIIIIDNYDSFTYNIEHALRQLGERPYVVRNDKLSVADADGYDAIIVSPGPGIPSEAGIMPDILRAYAGKKPILGICLGLQAIGELYGASLVNLPEVYHGIQSEITVDTDELLFTGLPQRVKVGRYHSWAIDPAHPGEGLIVTARSDDGNIMAIRHASHDVRGMQFHPESVLTPQGLTMLGNWLSHVKGSLTTLSSTTQHQ